METPVHHFPAQSWHWTVSFYCLGFFPIPDILVFLPLRFHQHPLPPHLHHLPLCLSLLLPLELRRKNSKVEIFWILTLFSKNLGNCSVCTTIKGQCQLPFSFDGQEFSSCTNHSDSRLWCATRLKNASCLLSVSFYGWTLNRVDSEGRLLRGVEAWDYCGSPCPAPGEFEAKRCYIFWTLM